MDNAGQTQASWGPTGFTGSIPSGVLTGGGLSIGTYGTAAQEAGLIESTTASTTEAFVRIRNLTAKVQALADATFGSVPQLHAAGESKTTGCAPSSGRADDLRREHAVLHGAISALESEFERLRGI